MPVIFFAETLATEGRRKNRSMASMTTKIQSLRLHHLRNSQCFSIRSSFSDGSSHRTTTRIHFNHLQPPLSRQVLLSSSHLNRRTVRHVAMPISAVGSGMEASITDDNLIALKDVKIVVESQKDDKMQVRVDVPGNETEKVFAKVLANLARSAPPIPGFQRQKGGKTSKVPRDFLLQILGEERVTNFVIQEIVTSTMTDYAIKENLKVKDKKITTTQKLEELKKLFTPGSEFGFNVLLELEKAETDTSS